MDYKNKLNLFTEMHFQQLITERLFDICVYIKEEKYCRCVDLITFIQLNNR